MKSLAPEGWATKHFHSHGAKFRWAAGVLIEDGLIKGVYSTAEHLEKEGPLFFFGPQ